MLLTKGLSREFFIQSLSYKKTDIDQFVSTEHFCIILKGWRDKLQM